MRIFGDDENINEWTKHKHVPACSHLNAIERVGPWMATESWNFGEGIDHAEIKCLTAISAVESIDETRWTCHWRLIRSESKRIRNSSIAFPSKFVRSSDVWIMKQNWICCMFTLDPINMRCELEIVAAQRHMLHTNSRSTSRNSFCSCAVRVKLKHNDCIVRPDIFKMINFVMQAKTALDWLGLSQLRHNDDNKQTIEIPEPNAISISQRVATIEFRRNLIFPSSITTSWCGKNCYATIKINFYR